MFVIWLIDHGSKAMFKNLPVIANSTRPSITGSLGDHIRMTPSATNNSCTCILAVGVRWPQRYVMRSISAPLTKYLALQQAWSGTLFKTLIRSLQSPVFGIWSSDWYGRSEDSQGLESGCLKESQNDNQLS